MELFAFIVNQSILSIPVLCWHLQATQSLTSQAWQKHGSDRLMLPLLLHWEWQRSNVLETSNPWGVMRLMSSLASWLGHVRIPIFVEVLFAKALADGWSNLVWDSQGAVGGNWPKSVWWKMAIIQWHSSSRIPGFDLPLHPALYVASWGNVWIGVNVFIDVYRLFWHAEYVRCWDAAI